MRRVFLSTALTALAFAPAAWAQATQAQAGQPLQAFEDWGVHCVTGAAPPCEMLQQGRNKAGQQVMSIALAYLPRDNVYALQITTPMGVLFRNGVKLNAGNWTSAALPYLRCDGQRCFVAGRVEGGVLDILAKTGDGTGKILIASAADGKTVALPMSLKGFAAARNAMESMARDKTAPASSGAPAGTTPAKPAKKR